MSKKSKTSPFTLDNPTDKWVLAIDGHFGYLAKDQATAFKVFDKPCEWLKVGGIDDWFGD